MKKKFTFLFSLLAVLCFTSVAQNSALSLDGISGAVTTTATIVPSSGDFTVEFWAYVPTPLASGVHEFVSQGGTAGSNFYIGFDGATGNIQAGDKWTNTGVAMPAGTWTHIALVNSAGTATLYVNGASKGTQPGYSITSGVTNFAIGQQYDGTGFVQGRIDQLRVWNVARSASAIKVGMYGSVDPSSAGLVADYLMDPPGSTALVLQNSASTGIANDGTPNSGASYVASPVQAGNNAVSFDASADTKIVAPTATQLDNLTNATIEFWANPNNIPGFGDVVGIRGTLGTKVSVHMSMFGFNMANGVGFQGVSFTPTNGTWYHVAFVIDDTQDTTGVFVNGAYLGQIPLGMGTATGLPLVLGASENFGGDADFFQGQLDEVRIWNTMRTQTEINANMNQEMVGNESGLVAYYNFNQGLPDGDNSFLTTTLDGTSNNNHGTLTNFALTAASASNFVASAPVIPLPVTFSSFTATPVKGSVVLQWATASEQNSRDFAIERSSDGTDYTTIGSVAAVGNSSSVTKYTFTDAAPLNGKNFYRLKESDLDNKFMYSPIRTAIVSNLPANALSWYATGDKSVQVQLKQGSNEWYTLTDAAGRVLRTGRLSSGKLDVTTPVTGVYTVKVWTSAGQVLATQVLIK